jgi:hypothetical protein
MYKWPNRCSQLRYRASAIPTTGTLAPVQDYSAYRQRLDTADFFSLRPNFSDNPAELFCQELATLQWVGDLSLLHKEQLEHDEFWFLYIHDVYVFDVSLYDSVSSDSKVQ